MLQLLRASLVVVYVALLYNKVGADDKDLEQLQKQQDHYACLLRYNEDILRKYHATIHGNATEQDMYAAHVSVTRNGKVRCWAARSCPNAPVTWCIHLYNPQQPIKMCLNSTNHVTYNTSAAAMLRLQDIFQLRPEVCNVRRQGSDCLSIISAKLFISNAYLSCTADGDTCYRKTYTDLAVGGSGEGTPRPTVDFDSKPELLLNQTNIFLCNATISEEFTGSIEFNSGWTIDGQPVRQRISRNPYCNIDPSKLDPEECSGVDPAERDRVREYKLLYRIDSCPFATNLRKTWLVIENATAEDAAKTYKCFSSYIGINPSKTNVTMTKTFEIHPVYQLSEVVTPQNSSNITFHLQREETLQWSCSVKAGVGDRLIWTRDGKEILHVDINYLTNLTLNQKETFALNNITCSSLKSLGDSVVVTDTKELGVFERQFTSTLFLCRVTEHTSGLYECVVNRSRGQTEKVALWSAEVFSLATGPSDPSKPQAQNAPVPIAVIITVPVVVVLLAFFVTLLSLCIRLHRKNKQQRHNIVWETAMGDMSVTNDILTEFRRSNSLKKDAVGPSLMNEPDPLEFPRNKLILLDQILGEGTFGVVRQAKAEGIVETTPERNIVAVKTTKAKAPPHEINNFWEELQLMKSMPPHGNIVNLLGYCTTPGGPLYMIIEYANHGSLKDFLKACQDTVLKLNHVPQVQASFRSNRASSTNSGFSTYPNLVFKTPVSAQNSVFSSVGTPTGIASASNSKSKFEFSPAVDKLSRERLVTQDSGFFGENIDNSSRATLNGVMGSGLTMAHSVAPLAHDYVNSKGLLYMEDVQNFALQIACGLKHLEDIQIVHCDLAARNILIAEGFVLKIGDFGMARDVSEKEYYRKQGGRIPVKWTAPEALKDHIFTFKSDIWSFGVILWEIFTYGQQPYPKFKIRQSWDPFINYIMQGNRLSQPTGCPDNFFELMQSCWHSSPDQRPTSEELVQVFSQTNLLYDDAIESADSSTLQSEESCSAGYINHYETQV